MQTTLLAIDDYAVPLRRNLCLYLTKPAVREEAVLQPEHDNPDAPDNYAAHFYGGVVCDAGKFRMWYYACHRSDSPDADPLIGDIRQGPVCYAESDDGITWHKPELGQVEWRGSRRNNIIKLATLDNEGVHVMRDDQDADANRRYKMVYNYQPASRNFWTVRTATSPDGLHWSDGPELPYDGFFEQTSLYRFNDLYYINGQVLLRGEGGSPSGRQGYALVSPDFEQWLQESGPSFLLPEPADPAGRGVDKDYDQVHIGVAPFSHGNVLVGLYCIWHNRAYPTAKDWFGMGTTSGDFGLLVSNDGLHFREPVKGHVFLHRNDSRPRLPAGIRYETVLCQGNGILNVGDETHIYHGRWANTEHVKDYHGEVALATLPRDRWGALGLYPDADAGSLWTSPVTIPASGAALLLNADDTAGMRVEVADERFNLLPAFSGKHAGVVHLPGGLDCPVTWPSGALDALAGATVRLRVQVARKGGEPRVYGMTIG